MGGHVEGLEDGDRTESVKDQSTGEVETRDIDGLEFMKESLLSFGNLRTLQIDQPSDDFLLYLMKSLAREAPSTLRKLALSMDCDKDGRPSEYFLGINILLGSERSLSLFELVISFNSIGLEGMKRLITGLSKNGSVETLRLTVLDGLDPICARLLSKFFLSADSGNIKHLELCDYGGGHGIWKDLMQSSTLFSLEYCDLVVMAIYDMEQLSTAISSTRIKFLCFITSTQDKSERESRRFNSKILQAVQMNQYLEHFDFQIHESMGDKQDHVWERAIEKHLAANRTRRLCQSLAQGSQNVNTTPLLLETAASMCDCDTGEMVYNSLLFTSLKSISWSTPLDRASSCTVQR